MVAKINSRKIQVPLPQKDNTVNILCVFTAGRYPRWLGRSRYRLETRWGVLTRMCPRKMLPVPASEPDWVVSVPLEPRQRTPCSWLDLLVVCGPD